MSGFTLRSGIFTAEINVIWESPKEHQITSILVEMLFHSQIQQKGLKVILILIV